MDQEEMQKIIDALSVEAIDEYRKFIREIEDFREDLNSKMLDYCIQMDAARKEITSNNHKMKNIESLIQSHAMAVQRVYDEMQEIKKLFAQDNIAKLLDRLKSCDEDRINASLIKIEEVMNDSKAREAVEYFDAFKNSIFRLAAYLDD